jgi:Domain of unknown function (DUF4389)
MDDELKQHVRDGNAWTRLLFMLLFAALYGVAEIVLTAVVIFQFLVVLFTGGKNARVLSLGASLSAYAYQIFRYLTYNSEQRPFPFADWPTDKALVEQAGQQPAQKAGSGQRRPAKTAAKSEATTEKTEESKPER